MSKPVEYPWSLPTDKIAAAAHEEIRKYYDAMLVLGDIGMKRTLYYQYHAGFFYGGNIQSTGAAGEYREISTGDFRNLVQHIVQLGTAKKIQWQVKGKNSDYASQIQAWLAPGLLDHYSRTKDLQGLADKAFEFAVLYGMGFLKVEWDTYGGENYASRKAPATDFDGSPMGEIEIPVKAGDLCYKAYQSIDMVYNWQRRDTSRPNWLMPRDWEDKFELADRYPHMRDTILNLEPAVDWLWDIDDWMIFRRADSSLIPVFTLYHEKTASLPRGRKMVMAWPDVVLEDGPLETEHIPIGIMAPMIFDRTNMGYGIAWDLLGPQKVKDLAESIRITNLATFGVQNIVVQDGTNIDVSEVEGGLNLIKIPQGAPPPTALNLISSQAEAKNLSADMTQQMEINSGIPSVTRGQPDPSLKSGNALALVQAQGLEFISRHQEAYYRMLEYVGNSSIDLLRKKMPDEKIVAIDGKLPGQYVKSFKAKDLEGVQMTLVEMGNAVSTSAAGNIQLAESMLSNGLIKDPKLYMQVRTTGKIDPAIEGVEVENMLIKGEQEQLLQGIVPPSLWTDDHPRHIRAALDLLGTPDARQNPKITQAVFGFIEQIEALWKNTPPEKLLAVGRQPYPVPPVGPMPPPTGPGAPPAGPEAGPPPGKDAQPPMPPQSGVNPGAPGIPPGQPMPTNPVTGQPWNPTNGGQ